MIDPFSPESLARLAKKYPPFRKGKAAAAPDLTPSQTDLVRLHVLNGKPLKEIAAMLGVSISAVESVIIR